MTDSAQNHVAPGYDPITGQPVSVGTSANDYDPNAGTAGTAYDSPEYYADTNVSVGTSAEGAPTYPIPGEGQYVDPGMYVENDGTTGNLATPHGTQYVSVGTSDGEVYNVPEGVGTGGTYVDPAYAHAYPPYDHPHTHHDHNVTDGILERIAQTLDRIEQKLDNNV